MTLSEAFLTFQNANEDTPEYSQAVTVLWKRVYSNSESWIRMKRLPLDPQDLTQSVCENRLFKQVKGLRNYGVKYLCERNRDDAEFRAGIWLFVRQEASKLLKKQSEATYQDSASLTNEDESKPLWQVVLEESEEIEWVQEERRQNLLGAVAEALSELPEFDQTILRSFFWDDQVYRQIAVAHGKSPKSVAWASEKVAAAEGKFASIFSRIWNER